MVISTITSGLGNQLFQYALGRQLSVRNNTSLCFDTRFYDHDYSRETQRVFKLDKFGIRYKKLNQPLAYLLKLTKPFPNRTLSPLFITVQEKYYHFDPTVLNTRAACVILKGYFQSEKYFSEVTDVIRDELKFCNIPSSEFHHYKESIMNSPLPVSVHIRRGDYVNHPVFSQTFGFIGKEYYEKAISLMQSKLGNCEFYIFTDDRKWVEEEFRISGKAVYVKNSGHDADLDDLHLMSLCRHHIIANSSYSWWGAWLNKNKDKMVIAPKNWYRNQPDWDIKDMIPDSWIKL